MFDERSVASTDRLCWLIGLVLVALLAPAVTACNTARGFGEDVEAAGGAVSDTAEEVQDEM